jgi:hypothetical protein
MIEDSVAQKLSSPKHKQIIVEYSHIFETYEYLEKYSFVAGKSMPQVENQNPEFVLATYLNSLAKGDVASGLKLWTVESQKLIARQNKNMTTNELVKNVKAQNEGLNFSFINKIKYGDYVIIDLNITSKIDSSLNKMESYALISENSIWKLTQDLADDPVMCCRKNNQNRIQKMGIPGGDFKQIIKALQ